MSPNERNIKTLQADDNIPQAALVSDVNGGIDFYLTGTTVLMHEHNGEDYNLMPMFHPNGINAWTREDLVKIGKALTELGEA